MRQCGRHRLQRYYEAAKVRGRWDVGPDGTAIPVRQLWSDRGNWIDDYTRYGDLMYAGQIPPQSVLEARKLSAFYAAIGTMNQAKIHDRARALSRFPIRKYSELEDLLYDIEPAPGQKLGPTPRSQWQESRATINAIAATGLKRKVQASESESSSDERQATRQITKRGRGNTFGKGHGGKLKPTDRHSDRAGGQRSFPKAKSMEFGVRCHHCGEKGHFASRVPLLQGRGR